MLSVGGDGYRDGNDWSSNNDDSCFLGSDTGPWVSVLLEFCCAYEYDV